MLLDRDLLNEFETRWRAQGAPVLANLSPGLSEEQIDATTAALGVRLPAEARLWWQWHDGVPASAVDLSVERVIGGPYYEYIPLEESASAYRTLREIATNVAGRDGDPDEFWHPSWWPISSDAKGAWLACQCDVPDDAPTPIRAIHFADGTHAEPPVLPSFGELVRHFIEAIDQGVWYFDPATGRWEHRFERQTAEQREARVL